jgi:site-specific recombinase XerD
MREALNIIAAILTDGKSAVGRPALSAYGCDSGALIERYTPSMANKALAALRGVHKEAWRLGYMTAEDFHRATDVPTITPQTLPRGRALAAGEIAALMSSYNHDGSPAGIRDVAVVALRCGAGLRRSEGVSADLSDYNPRQGNWRFAGLKVERIDWRTRPMARLMH